MSNVVERIQKAGIVPVVVVEDAKDAEALAGALCRGGLLCAEITFRTGAAEQALRTIAERYSNMLLGAGTVLSVEQVDRAVSAGAKFIVTPGFDLEIVDYCINKGITIIPGIVTPSELTQAVKRGLKVVKFFPAEASGGLAMIQNLAAPFPMVQFMPTGGINSGNVKEYLRDERIICCGGSWMVRSSLISGQNFKEIEELTAEAVKIVRTIRR